MKRSGEKSRAYLTSKYDPWAHRLAFAAAFAGLALAIPSYLKVFKDCRSQQSLSVTFSSLPAGGTGYVAVRLAGSDSAAACRGLLRLNPPGLTVPFTFASDGTALCALNLRGVAPGPAELTAESGGLKLALPVVLQSSTAWRLWVTRRRDGDSLHLEALLWGQSCFSASARSGTPVCFKLLNPHGALLNRRDLTTDPQGVATYSLSLHLPPAGTYTLCAVTESHTLKVPVVVGEQRRAAPGPASGPVPRSPAPPGGPIRLSVTSPRRPDGSLDLSLQATEACGLSPGESYVLEVLLGSVPVSARKGMLQAGKARHTILLPPTWGGPLFVRVWPVERRGKAGVSCLRLDSSNRMVSPLVGEILSSDRTAVVLQNPSARERLFAYALFGDGSCMTADSFPKGPGELPFAGTFTAFDPARSKAPYVARFWCGLFIFLFALPLLRILAVLCDGARYGLCLFTLTAGMLYAATALTYRLFAPCVAACALLWLYRTAPDLVRSLHPTGRVGLRWAVVLLALAPYLFVDRLPVSETTFASGKLRRPSVPTVPHNRQASPPGIDLVPGARIRLPVPPGAQHSFVLLSPETGPPRTASLSLNELRPLELSLPLPHTLTGGKRGDLIACPLALKNTGTKPWRGTVQVRASGACTATLYERASPILIAPGATWRGQIQLRGVAPGPAALSILSEGSGQQRWDFSLRVLPHGRSEQTVLNGFSRPHGQGKAARPAGTFTLSLPSSCLYKTANLSAHLFPGPVSHLLWIMDNACRAPWPEEERLAVRAHAACLALLCAQKSGQKLPREQQVRSTLASALNRLLRCQKPDGGFAASAGNRLRLTASVLLLFRDLGTLWGLQPEPVKKAIAFLRSQVRADGTFRTSLLRAHPTREDTTTTALLCLSLKESTPALTLAYMKRLLRGNSGDAGRAPALAALLECGAVKTTEATQLARSLSMPFPSPSAPRAASPFLVYGLARLPEAPEITKKTLGSLFLARTASGTLPELWETQLFMRALLLCARAGPRLAENVFHFTVNGHLQARCCLRRTDPDEPVTVDLTDALHMDTNSVAVAAEGSAYTAYQLSFSYALPWEEPGISAGAEAPFSVALRLPPKAPSLGTSVPLTLSVTYHGSTPSPPVRAFFTVPPVFSLQGVAKPLTVLSGKGRPGETVLLLIPPCEPGKRYGFALWVRTVSEGSVFLRPPRLVGHKALPPPGENRRLVVAAR